MALVLIVLAWMPVVFGLMALWVIALLWHVPSGEYWPWRRVWLALLMTLVTMGAIWTRNALILSPVDHTSWAWIEYLLRIDVRVILCNLSALGILGCVWEAYRIFRRQTDRPPIPVAQVQMSWRGKIIGWNAQATLLLGYTWEEVKDQELAAILIPERLREAHRAGLEHYRLTGESHVINHEIAMDVLHRDGHEMKVNLYVTVHQSNHITTFLGSLFPVSPRP